MSFLESIKMQNPSIQARLDQLIYRIVEQLYNHGFISERFDRKGFPQDCAGMDKDIPITLLAFSQSINYSITVVHQKRK